MKGKTHVHYIVSHRNIVVIGELFITSLVSWGDARLLDTGATSKMTFQRYFFEDFDDNVYGVVYFANRSSIKPLGMGTIKLNFPRLTDFLLCNVLYLPKLQRILLSLVHIRKQGHFVHMIGGRIEIRKDSDNMLVMIKMEE